MPFEFVGLPVTPEQQTIELVKGSDPSGDGGKHVIVPNLVVGADDENTPNPFIVVLWMMGIELDSIEDSVTSDNPKIAANFLRWMQDETMRRIRDERVFEAHLKDAAAAVELRKGKNIDEEFQQRWRDRYDVMQNMMRRGGWNADAVQWSMKTVDYQSVGKVMSPFANLRADIQWHEVLLYPNVHAADAAVHIPKGMSVMGYDIRQEDAHVCHKKQCAQCGEPKTMERKMWKCGGCLVVKYCGTECQKKHWKRHKPICKSRKHF